MPLKAGRTKQVFSANVSELLKSGRKLNQALAIADSKRRQSYKKKKTIKKLDTSRETDTWENKGMVYQEMGPGRTKPRLLGPSNRSYTGVSPRNPQGLSVRDMGVAAQSRFTRKKMGSKGC